MADIKYIAAGFLTDAKALLRDFMSENSMEFSAFAHVWKMHNFSLIYAGRVNGKELRDFTLEIFQLCIDFLKQTSLLHQVGATFLLYALYRNQIMSPPLKIRITSSQFQIIMALLDISCVEKNPSLHYIINYLVENSFDFVYCPKLKGPNSIKNELHRDNEEFHLQIQETEIKYELTEIAKNNELHEINELFVQYELEVQTLDSSLVDITVNYSSFKDLELRIDKLLNDFTLSDEDSSSSGKDAGSLRSRKKKDSAIGSRRALIKAAAFSQPISHFLSHGEDEGIESAAEEVPSKSALSEIHRKRRSRRGKRKVGRPKKVSVEGSVNEEDARSSQKKRLPDKGISGRRRRRPRGPEFAKIRHYYEENVADWDDLNMPSTSNTIPKECLFSSNSDGSELL